MLSETVIREIRLGDTGILEELIYEAIFQPDPNHRLPREVIRRSDISVYIDNWGQPDDLCLVAECGGKLAGAVWTRMLAGKVKGYGTLDSDTPEFAIALFEKYRGQGIGSLLMRSMIELLKVRGYKRASLSVSKHNSAARLYLRLGFHIVEEREEEYIMAIDLRKTKIAADPCFHDSSHQPTDI